MWFTVRVIVCLGMYNFVNFLFWIAVWPFFWRWGWRGQGAGRGVATVLSAFCLSCFDCGAVALSASFFPFGILDGRLR